MQAGAPALVLAFRWKKRGLTMIPPSSSPPWELHPQLDKDTTPLGELPLSRVLVMNDANYPWLLLVPCRPGIVELIDLNEPDRVQLMTEIARVAGALKSVTACDKLNIAALGNVVSQLHVHIIARRTGDPAWPKPVWGVVPSRAYDAHALDRFAAALRRLVRVE